MPFEQRIRIAILPEFARQSRQSPWELRPEIGLQRPAISRRLRDWNLPPIRPPNSDLPSIDGPSLHRINRGDDETIGMGDCPGGNGANTGSRKRPGARNSAPGDDGRSGDGCPGRFDPGCDACTIN
jgi:hypothetical protein